MQVLGLKSVCRIKKKSYIPSTLEKEADNVLNREFYADAHPLFHSDRGFQYTSRTFYNKLQKAKMRQSMSRVGRYQKRAYIRKSGNAVFGVPIG